MDDHTLKLILATAAGVASGFINTLSGGGSYLVLPMLLGLGLDSRAANATNRVGVLVSSLVAFKTFQSTRPLAKPLLVRLAVPSVIGAILGAGIAIQLDTRVLDLVIGGLLLGMLGLVIAKPERFIRNGGNAPDASRARTFAIMLAIGVYGGFIQAGVGLFLIVALVLEVGLSLVSANAAKVLLVFLFTAPALLIFGAARQVDWPIGLLLATGQAAGAYAAARYASRKAEAEIWIRRLLLVVLPLTTIKLWFFSGH